MTETSTLLVHISHLIFISFIEYKEFKNSDLGVRVKVWVKFKVKVWVKVKDPKVPSPQV